MRRLIMGCDVMGVDDRVDEQGRSGYAEGSVAGVLIDGGADAECLDG